MWYFRGASVTIVEEPKPSDRTMMIKYLVGRWWDADSESGSKKPGDTEVVPIDALSVEYNGIKLPQMSANDIRFAIEELKRDDMKLHRRK